MCSRRCSNAFCVLAHGLLGTTYQAAVLLSLFSRWRNWDTEVLKPLTPVSRLGNGGAGTQTLAASPVGSPNALGPLGPWQWRPRGELVYVEFQIPFTSFCLLRGTC